MRKGVITVCLRCWLLIYFLVAFFPFLTLPQANAQRGIGQPADTAPLPAEGRRMVVVVGIDQYKAWPRLTNATNDAVGFERELREKLGFVEAAPPLLNQQATRQAIQHLVDDVLYRQLKGDDELVLFFAGHGTTRVDPVGGREIETGFLVPVEARSPGQEEEWSDYVQVDQFLASIGRLPARHILVILDACHSGFALGRAMDTLRGDVRYRQDVSGRVSRKVITSARRNQAASDRGPVPDHSLFTGTLIDGIDSGAADMDSDGVVTSSELGLYLQQAVGKASDTAQTPDFGSFYLDDRGELVLPLGSQISAGSPRLTSRRRTIALLGFKDLSGRTDQPWLSTALSELLTTEASAGDKLRIIPGENVSLMQKEKQLPDIGQLSPENLGTVYRSLGSDIVITGSYLKVGDQLRIDVHVQDALSGETIASFSNPMHGQSLLEIVGELGEQLRQKLGIGEIAESEANKLKTSHPASTEALQLYAEGLGKLRNFDAKGAREPLEKAVALDPNYAPAHSALAEVWTQLGYDEKAKREGKLALDSAKNLPRKDALLIEARYEALSGAPGRAADIYRSLWTFFPDEFDYGIYLAKALVSAGKGEEAGGAVRMLRQFPKPMSEDPRIDLTEAKAAESLAQYRQELTAAAQAIEKARRGGHGLLEAQGYSMECAAFRNLTDFDHASEAGQHARRAFSSAQDSMGLAKSLTCLGNVAIDRGDLQSARQLHEQALFLATQLGSQKDIAGALINVGTVLQSQNDLVKATEYYQKASATALTIGDKQQLLLAQNDLGTVFDSQGEFDQARDMYERAVAIAREVGDQGMVVAGMANLGIIDYFQGELPKAQRQIEAAAGKAKELGMDTYAAQSIVSLGDVLAAQGELKQAEQKYRDSLEICQKAKENSCVASARLSLAALSLENNQASPAETMARDALAEFETERNIDQETAAHDVLAQALMLEGKLSDAQLEIDRARGLAAQDQVIVLSRGVSSGRLLGFEGKFDAAAEELDSAMDRANAMKLVGWQLQVRFRKAQLQVLAGKAKEGREALRFVEREAAERGYLLLSRKAAASAASKEVSSGN